MNYEIVNIKSKHVTGIKIRTSNSIETMQSDIGGLWQNFLQKGIYEQIKNKKDGIVIGLYTNYENNVEGEYDFVACCETEYGKNKELVNLDITEGNYAKFILKGNTTRIVSGFWNELWKMDLDRKFTYDFEEYQEGCNMENAEIHFYIALK